MDAKEEQTVWSDQPKWDAQHRGWYWEGQRLEGNQIRRVTVYLREDEFGPNGYPRPDAVPPGPSAHQQQPTHAPLSNNFDTPYLPPGQQTVYPVTPSHESLAMPGRDQTSQNYQTHDDRPRQERSASSTSGRKNHKVPSDKRSAPTQALPTHFEASLQNLSLQNYEFQNPKPFTAPVAHTTGLERGNQSPYVNPYSQHLSFQLEGTGSSQPSSSNANNGVLPTYHWGAQIHTGASWAGGPSNGNSGLPAIPVKDQAIGRIRHVTRNNNIFLDSNFDIYPSVNFEPGKIIKVWWCEPLGMSTRGAFGSRLSRPNTLLSDHKKAIWAGFRRFIIIRNFEGHCHGVPIYTYGGQGCTKSGVKHREHGAVYEDSPGSIFQLLPNEKSLGFPSIRARTTYGEPMDRASRVNYAKVADIGHNLMVNFVAKVVPEDWNIAKNALQTSGFA